MKTKVTNWLMEISSTAAMFNIKVKEITLSQKDYDILIKELNWSSRIKPTQEEHKFNVDIVSCNGLLRVRRDFSND